MHLDSYLRRRSRLLCAPSWGAIVSLTLAKYLQTVSADVPRSWLKGQAFPAWQAPWRKNLQGTCEVSGMVLSASAGGAEDESQVRANGADTEGMQAGVLDGRGWADDASGIYRRTRGAPRPVESWGCHGRARALAVGDVEAPGAHVAIVGHGGGGEGQGV